MIQADSRDCQHAFCVTDCLVMMLAAAISDMHCVRTTALVGHILALPWD